MNKSIIPIFYACDDNFVKYTIVSLYSLIKNAETPRKYRVYVLNTNISPEMREKLLEYENRYFEICFVNVKHQLEQINTNLPIRDYYTKTTYFRFFIPEMFPEYDKAIYIDSDTIVQGNIAELFDTDIGDNYVGACHEQAMVQVDAYGTYCERVVGVSRHNYFNAGLMLMNCDQFRKRQVMNRFIKYLGEYNFVVTQDEDYLNLICKDHVHWLDSRFNTEIIGDIGFPIEESKIIHYMMVSKPWHYKDCRHGDIFWSYADKTNVAAEIRAELESYTDEERARDAASADALMALAIAETNKADNYQNILDSTVRAKDRVEVIRKIQQYEKEGRFTEDVEDDPPTVPLKPGEVDYLRKKPINKIKQAHATRIAKKFLNRIIKDKMLIVKEIRGAEKLAAIKSGAVITCNHFNAMDSFAMHVLYEASGHKKRKMYRVVREGNYTSFPGFYGYLMRNFYTLPLAQSSKVMAEFLRATGQLLKDGNFVLVYPEQSMWWNYRKPKPLQPGAFSIAAKNGVPVLPVFITMQDSDVMGGDGFPIQEYTIHVGDPIYPDKDKTNAENAALMQKANAECWKEIYEGFYSMSLEYTTK